MRKLLIDTQKLNATYLRMNLALADSISRSEAEEGQIIVMDIQESSVIGHAALKLHDGEGGFVTKVSHLENPFIKRLSQRVCASLTFQKTFYEQ